MSNEYKAKSPNIGGSSLLVIFSVLCLVVFAILCLATLQSDRRLFDSMMTANMGYYDADRAAEEILASLRAGEEPADAMLTSVHDGISDWSYRVSISDTTALDCAVSIWPDGSYQVSRWALVNTKQWDGNFDTPVFVD